MLGFVAIPRELLESNLFADADLFRIFIWLVSRANYREPRECLGAQVGPGQLIVGRRSMAEKLGLDPSKIDRALKRLASPKYRLIERSANRSNTLVTICNFYRYRPKPKQGRTAIGPQSNRPCAISEPSPNRERTQTNREPITIKQEQEQKPIRVHTEVACSAVLGTQYSANGSVTGDRRRISSEELSHLSMIHECEFREFYEAYGKKVAKGAARMAFFAALNKATSKTITQAASNYSAAFAGCVSEMKSPAAWLDGECWDDDQTQWVPLSRIAKKRPAAAIPECPI